MTLTDIINNVREISPKIIICEDSQGKYAQVFFKQYLIANIIEDPVPIKICKDVPLSIKIQLLPGYFKLKSICRKYRLSL